MIFKERTFHGEAPENERPADPPSAMAGMEARAAEVLSTLNAFDVTGISVVATSEGLVLSGYAPSERDAMGALSALRTFFPDTPLVNGMKIG